MHANPITHRVYIYIYLYPSTAVLFAMACEGSVLARLESLYCATDISVAQFSVQILCRRAIVKKIVRGRAIVKKKFPQPRYRQNNCAGTCNCETKFRANAQLREKLRASAKLREKLRASVQSLKSPAKAQFLWTNVCAAVKANLRAG